VRQHLLLRWLLRFDWHMPVVGCGPLLRDRRRCVQRLHAERDDVHGWELRGGQQR
jgi:hypothetical protein